VDDAARCIDQIHRCRQRIEAVGQGRGLHLLQIDDSANQDRTAHVRRDQTHPVFCLVVDHAILAAPDQLKQRAAYRRFFQQTEHVVDHPLRSHPFERKPGSA
jgi:hypothetical protein